MPPSQVRCVRIFLMRAMYCVVCHWNLKDRSRLFTAVLNTLLHTPKNICRVSVEITVRCDHVEGFSLADDFYVVLRDIPSTVVDWALADQILDVQVVFVFKVSAQLDAFRRTLEPEFVHIKSQLPIMAAKGLLSGSLVCSDGGEYHRLLHWTHFLTRTSFPIAYQANMGSVL